MTNEPVSSPNHQGGRRQLSIDTEYFSIQVHEDGRGFEVRLLSDIKASMHHRYVLQLVNMLLDRGVIRINADQVRHDDLDRTLGLWRGNRKVDITYEDKSGVHDWEIKTTYEIGQDRTWRQLKEMVRFSKDLTLCVPESQKAYAETLLIQTGLATRIKLSSFVE